MKKHIPNILTLLKAYQKENMLTAAELWAIPEMISHCLLENAVGQLANYACSGATEIANGAISASK